MTGLFESERKSFSQASDDLFTTRYGHFVLKTWNERLIYTNFSQKYTTYRNVIWANSEFHSDRYCIIVKVVNRHHTNRICYMPPADPDLSQRYVVYNVGTQFIVYTLQAVAPLTLTDTRKAFVEKNIVSNRTVFYYCPPFDERLIYISILRQIDINTPQVATSLKLYSTRTITYVIGATTQRSITLVYTTGCDRTGTYYTYQEAVIDTPEVVTTLTNLASKRYCISGGNFIHSDRYAYFLTEPYSDRYIALHYTVGSERKVTFYLGRVFYLYDFIATPSKLVASERLLLTRGIVYLTERAGFCEMRPVWKKKTPLSSSPLVNIRSSKDEKASVKIVNDRALELYGLNGEVTESVGLTEHRIVDQSKDNTLDVSATDNKGAALNSFGENVEKKLVKSYIFKIPVTFT